LNKKEIKMKILTLNLKSEYFNDIKDDKKFEEYRLVNEYWKKRLEGKSYDLIVLCKGYPAKNDNFRRIIRKWNGYVKKKIIHKHFNNELVEVFAIDVSKKIDNEQLLINNNIENLVKLNKMVDVDSNIFIQADLC